jgi:hypothetical protein
MNHFLKITNMKLTKIILNLLVFTCIGTSQLFAQAADPSVNGATVNPAPLPAPGATGSNNVSVFFSFANASTTAIPLSALNVINVSLSNLAVNGAFSAANVTTTGGDYFTFSYDVASKTLTATQKAVIPGLAGELITITGLIVAAPSDRSNPQNGLNVNVSFLRTYNAELGNDNTSAFTFTGSGGVTPIHLLTFNGIKEDNKVQLKWQTSSELNTKLFDVEFSENGQQWNSIGTIDAAGNSSTPRDYALLHKSPVNGVNYYRLKQVDASNSFSYSNIVAINFTIRGVTINSVYPNPFVSQLKIDVSSDRSDVVRIQLSDNLGRVIKVQNASLQKGVNRILLDNLAGLGSGIYNVEVKTAYSTSRFKLKK